MNCLGLRIIRQWTLFAGPDFTNEPKATTQGRSTLPGRSALSGRSTLPTSRRGSWTKSHQQQPKPCLVSSISHTQTPVPHSPHSPHVQHSIRAIEHVDASTVTAQHVHKLYIQAGDLGIFALNLLYISEKVYEINCEKYSCF